MATLLVNLGVVLLLLVGAILIKYAKFYWLIAGYNTAPAEVKERTDIEGLARMLGNGLLVMAGLWLLGGIFQYLGHAVVFLIFIGLFVAVLLFVVFRGQRYYFGDQPGRVHRLGPTIALTLIISVSIFTGGLLIYGSRPAGLQIHEGTVKISGVYGTTIPVANLRGVALLESLPRIERKVNGFDFGNVLKGWFRLAGLGRCRLLVHTDRPPFIRLATAEGCVILNFPEPDRTREAFGALKAASRLTRR